MSKVKGLLMIAKSVHVVSLPIDHQSVQILASLQSRCPDLIMVGKIYGASLDEPESRYFIRLGDLDLTAKSMERLNKALEKSHQGGKP